MGFSPKPTDALKLNLELYRKLYLARQAEESIRAHYAENEMKTPMHMSMGEEAIAVGVVSVLGPDDQIFATYRSHAIYLARTEDSDDFFAEMYGKETARLKGKGGSMHMCDPERGFMGTSAIVASAIPVAVGAAFASRKQGNDTITVAFFGDGACDEGVFWESLNLACLMKLPVLFVCEDNGLAVHTPQSLRQGYRSIAAIVSKFNCQVLEETSTDAEVIYDLTRKAINLIKANRQPVFMHLQYYRYLEHVGVNEDFDAGYRSRKEFEEWRQVDPVNLQRKKLLGNGTSETEIAKIETKIDRQIENSLKKAKDAPFANDAELCRGVFS